MQLDLLAYQPGQPISEAKVIVSAVEQIEFRGEEQLDHEIVIKVTLEEAVAILYAEANGFLLLPLVRSGGE